ncbi:MAG: PTS sugar transporter subunit IIA [Sedimentisphaerales bacterium]|nr:PTS sugar transporter subunit IIA [Sedimentisphaerales bacterium]
MELADFVCFEATVAKLKSTDRNKVIGELVASLDNAGKLGKNNVVKITRAIIRRENEASTGLGKGVAIPHVKHPVVTEPVAAVGLSTEEIDFKSLDEQPVYSVILLISPTDDPEKHLRAMECIVGHLQKEQFRNFLRQADSSEYIEDLFRETGENPAL